MKLLRLIPWIVVYAIAAGALVAAMEPDGGYRDTKQMISRSLLGLVLMLVIGGGTYLIKRRARRLSG